MLLVDQALKIVLDSARQLGSERVDISEAASRILAADVKSDIDMPTFDKSAMDGYACRRSDLANELVVIEIIPAGEVPQKTIEAGECSKIMTGAMIPGGADCVIMVEFTEKTGEKTIRFIGEKTSDNICKKAEDMTVGQLVLKKGSAIEPQHIATLACVGCVNPEVIIRPKVGVIATGHELVAPSEKPNVSQIRNSNSYQISAQAEKVGAVVTNYGIVSDGRTSIDSLLKKAIAENDVVIISGGVSMGDFDFVPEILKQNNVKLLFEKIALKPGKPAVFGLCEKSACFGLPGNPVSGFVVFELLVKPFLYKMMGYDYTPLSIQLPLDSLLKRKKTKRQSWVPVSITKMATVKPIEYHGSAHVSALCYADGLINMNIGVAEIEKGTMVPVRLI